MTANPIVDTSVVVRYLTGDVPALAEEAAQILDGDARVQVTDVVLVETAYVLTHVYGVAREAVVDCLVGLLQKRNIAVFGLDKATVVEALEMCRPSGRVSFADALIWAGAIAAKCDTVYSFDARFPDRGLDVRRAPRQQN